MRWLQRAWSASAASPGKREQEIFVKLIVQRFSKGTGSKILSGDFAEYRFDRISICDRRRKIIIEKVYYEKCRITNLCSGVICILIYTIAGRGSLPQR